MTGMFLTKDVHRNHLSAPIFMPGFRYAEPGVFSVFREKADGVSRDSLFPSGKAHFFFGSGFHVDPNLLQGIFLTQGSNPGLLHCRQTLYPLSHQGSQFRYTK